MNDGMLGAQQTELAPHRSRRPQCSAPVPLSGPQDRRQTQRQNGHHRVCPLWISSPTPDSWRRATYPQFHRALPTRKHMNVKGSTADFSK